MHRLIACTTLLSFLSCLTPALAEPVTLDRLDDLPADDRPAWREYWVRSQAAAAADQAALDAEVRAGGMTTALPAPDGGDFKVSAKPGDPWYAGDEARQLVDIVLSYQTPTGGWSKHTGYSRGPRKPGMLWSSQYQPGDKPHYLATFDNRSTTEQLRFLANVWRATGRDDCKAAFIKGLNFVLSAQYPNGGWPQVYPLEGGYHDDITFNDDAMTHVLDLLHGIESREPMYEFLDDAQRSKASAALARGIDCVLKLQVDVGGKRTVWCAQNDPITLKPSGARAMEPRALSGLESARLLEMLMRRSRPSPELIAAIEAGLAWLESAKVTGVAKADRDGKTVYVADPASTQTYWARFYDIATGKPIFPGRDGIIYDTYEAMAAANRVGYDYYSTIPGSVLNSGQKKWRKMLTQSAE